MKQRTTAAFLLALGLVTLAGCSTPSVITLNDGREIQTVDPVSYTHLTLPTICSV